jgi:hypothetical protein
LVELERRLAYVSPPSLSSSPPVLLKFGSIVNGALARVLANEAAGHDRQKVTALGVGRGRWAITTAILVRRRQCF